MKDSQEMIMLGLEPEVREKLISRREALLRAGKLGLGALSVPLAVTLLAKDTFGQNSQLPQQIVDVLNFALTLEELEAEFYTLGNRAKNLIPKQTSKVFDTLQDHEQAHVKLLRTVLGKMAIPKPQFDFTAGGTFADVFSNYQTFLALSQAFEDTGVRAYKGQATNLMANGKILETALQIHSVEARHAAMIRRIRGEKEWITGSSRGSLPPQAQAVYDGEENTVQGGIDFAGAGGTPRDAASQTFDEPLTRAQVLSIANLFIRS